MKLKTIAFALSALCLLFLSGCSSNNNSMNKQNQQEEIQKKYEEYLNSAKSYQKKADDYMHQGGDYVKVKDYEQGIIALVEAINYFEKSNEYFLQAKKLNPNVESDAYLSKLGLQISYHIIGSAWYDLKNYDKAIEFCQKSLNVEIEDDIPRALNYKIIGASYYSMGLYTEAFDALTKSLNLNPNDESVREALKITINAMQ